MTSWNNEVRMADRSALQTDNKTLTGAAASWAPNRVISSWSLRIMPCLNLLPQVTANRRSPEKSLLYTVAAAFTSTPTISRLSFPGQILLRSRPSPENGRL